MPQNQDIKSNIKIRPSEPKIAKLPNKKKSVSSGVSAGYFFSWGLVAALSLAGVSYLVMQEGGVSNAIRTAGFNKINREIASNIFSSGADNLPTASIPNNGKIDPNLTTQSIPKDTFTPPVTPVGANRSVEVNTTYFTVFLGQSGSKSKVLDLWYSTKNKNLDLLGNQKAAYYYDEQNAAYNLVVGKFKNLGDSLKFCAELKFNDIACRYDSEFANLQTTAID